MQKRMAKNNARLTDPTMLIQAGIDPATGLPIKAKEGKSCNLKLDIKKQLRIMDEQDAINRFTWYNLPEGLNSRLIERILYYKGQGMLFFLNDKFYFLPYALDGTIDVYGRFMSVTPLPFNGTANDGKPETGLLAENMAEGLESEATGVLDEATGILEGETTGLLIDENATAPLDAPAHKYPARTGGKKLEMLDEVMLVHTEEVI